MKHVGTIGERKYVFVKCVKSRTFQNSFGYTHMNFLEDRFGNHFVYKGSKVLSVGHFYGMTVTIKSHEEYQGTLQTWLGRPKIEKHLDQDGKVM